MSYYLLSLWVYLQSSVSFHDQPFSIHIRLMLLHLLPGWNLLKCHFLPNSDIIPEMSYRPFWDNYGEWRQNDLETLKGQRFPSLPSQPPIPLHFTAGRRFQVTGHSDKCTKWPQNALKNVKGIPYTYCNYPGVPKFTYCRSAASRFQVSGYFETSAPNDPKWL